jgi:hypothetical protein
MADWFAAASAFAFARLVACVWVGVRVWVGALSFRRSFAYSQSLLRSFLARLQLFPLVGRWPCVACAAWQGHLLLS